MKVLCLFKYVGQDDDGMRELTDAVMIDVLYMYEIPEAFHRRVLAQRRKWVGPFPIRWELTGYLPETGRPLFGAVIPPNKYEDDPAYTVH